MLRSYLSLLLCGLSAILLVTPSVSQSVFAGKYNPNVEIGAQPAGWTDLPGVDDQRHSLKDLADRDVVVVVFTCNSCPYAVDYEERINRLAEKYSVAGSRVGVVAINVNKVEADLMPAMKKRAQERKFKFPYLFDETQQIAKAFGAVRTPEFFVLNKERRIVYMGAMDDNTKENAVKVHYLEDAIQATLSGKPIATTETPPVGCLIRFVRERKKQ
ncbi:MAG: thioredoxin family protein [Pirellulaceae bacterium]|nr:thioredoxin family protein [Pirellulaceae bacterium]